MAAKKKVKSWSEMSAGEKKAVLVGWAAIIVVGGYLLFSKEDEQPPVSPPVSVTPQVPAETQAVTYTTANPDALVAATQYIAQLDKAMQTGVGLLKAGELPIITAHSQAFGELVDSGYAQFGSSAFEPLGRCGVAGNYARTWWQAQLSAAQNKGVELTPGAIQSALDEYQSNRTECIKSADPVVAAKENAELKEKFGGGRECLTVFTVDPETKEVVAKPKPEHCKS